MKIKIRKKMHRFKNVKSARKLKKNFKPEPAWLRTQRIWEMY